MTVLLLIFAALFIMAATLGVALIASIVKEDAWQGSALRLPVRSDDTEVVRHVHRASLPILGALVFIALAHGATLLILAFYHSVTVAVKVAVIVAGVVTIGGLAATIISYAKHPHVKR